MNVTIVGAGNMGRGIGTRLVAGGHRVTLVDRTPENARKLAESLNAGRAGAGSATTGELEAIHDDVIVLAVGYGANVALARQLGAALDAKIVVDIANRLFGPSDEEVESARRLLAAATGGAERFEGEMIERMHVEQARWVLAKARV